MDTLEICNIKDSHAVLFKRYEGNYALGVKNELSGRERICKINYKVLELSAQKALSQQSHSDAWLQQATQDMHISKLHKI